MSTTIFRSMLPIALVCALLGSVVAVQAQTLYTQNFSSFTAGTGISGDNGVACSATGTGPAADGTSTQTVGGVTWLITAPPAALPDECSFIKVINDSGNNRLHTRNLRGEEGCFRLSGISISGYQAVVSLDLGIDDGIMEAGDSAIIKVYVDGSATPALVQRYGFVGNSNSFSVSYTSPNGTPFTGSTLDLEVCFRCGDAPPATSGALETWYLDNIVVTGIACAAAVNISGQANPCPGSTHTYSIASPPANHTFVWSLPDGGGTLTPAMDGLSAEVTWNGAGPRTVRVTATDLTTSCVDNHDYAITVRTAPTVAALSDLGPFCPGSNLPAISLSTSPVNSDVSFSWSGGAAIGIPDGSDDTSPFAIPAFTTQNASATVLSPTISVIATDEIYGCVGDPETFTVTVNPAPDLVFSGSPPAICVGDTYDLSDLIDGDLTNGEVVDQNDVMNLGFLVYFQQPYISANQQFNLMVSPMTTTTYYFVKPTSGGCNDDLAVVLTVSATPVSNATTNTNYATLQAAIDAATAGDVITLNCDHTEGLVTINKPLTLQGGGKVLTSTSASWGVSIAANGVVIEDITVEDAGTFGIITQCGFSNLTITNATVRDGGGTGFAINGVDNVMLNNITALNNEGNGISISDCNNVTIDGITTSGNAFGGGFSAGVGIFSGGACSPPAGVTNVTITGEVNISEPTTVYEQILGGGGMITNTVVNPTSGTTPPQTHALGIANSRFFTPDLATAFAAAQTVINDPMTPTSNTLVYVEEISSRDHFLDIALAPDMIIQPAITYAYPDITVHIAEGTYVGNVNATGMGQAVILSPGSSPGIVTISGDLILDSDDELVMEIDGVTPGTEHDQFVVTGTVNLGGADLSLTVAPLTAGQQITLIDGSSAIMGQFAQGNTITIGMDTYSIIYNGGMDGFDVVLTVCGPSVTVDNNGSLCPDATLELTTVVSGGFGPYTYNWSGPNGFASMNANPAIPNVSAANEGVYSVTVTDATLCSTVGTTTFSLFPVPTVSATTDLPTGGSISVACTNEDFTITIDGTGNPVGTTYSANWSLSALFGSPNLMLVSGTGDFATKPTSPSTATTISGSFINPLPNENSIQIDLTITATTPDGCSESFDLVVYLRPEVTVSGIAPGLPAAICSGDDVPAQTITLLPSAGTRSINWDWSGVDITATPADGSDAAAPFEVSLTGLVNSGGAIQTATLAVTPLLSYVTPVAQVCAGDVALYTTQVDPGPAVMDQTDMACSDAAIGLTLGASTNSVPAATYNVSVFDDGGLTASNGPGIGSGLPANAIANDAWTNTSGADVDVTYEVVPVSSNGCEGDPFTVTVTIESAPVLNAPAPNVFVCSDAELNTVFSAVAATNSLNITSITVNSVMLEAGLTANPGNITAPDTGAPDFFLADSYRNFTNGGLNATYNITATADNGCTASADYVFRVRGEPVLDPNLDETICSGENTEITLALDPLTGFQSATGYDILSITPDAGLTAGMGNASVGNDQSPTAIFNDTWINGTMGPLAVVYAIAPRRANDCVGETVLVTVTVDPGPNVANATATVCSDAPAGVVFGASSNLVPAATYTILSIAPAMGLTPAMGNASTGAGQAANAIEDDMFTNLTSGNLDVVYTVTPVSTAGCIGPDFTVTLTIRPEPVVPFQSGDMACSDEPINVTLGNSNPFVSAFNITNIDANMLTASAGNPMTGLGFDDNEIEDDAWTNTTGMPVNVIYTVVPISLDGCPGDFFTVTVQIKPEPVGSNTSIPNTCSDKALNFDLLAHVPGAANFTYTVASSNPVGVPPAPNRAMPSSANITDTYTNLTTDEVTITYTVTPISADGCVGETFTVTVIIEAEPVVASQTATACSDTDINVTLGDDVDGPFAVFYNVTGVSVPMGLTPNPANAVLPSSMFPVQFSSNAALADDQYTNLTNAPLDVVYTVVPLSDDGCEGNSFSVTVTISPEPVVANVPLDNVCSDQPIGYVLPATDDDGLTITSYDITASVDMDLSGMATEGNGITDVNAIAGDIFTNLNDAGRLVVYTITPYAGDCAGTPFTVTFNIRAEPVLNPGLDKMVCSDELLALTLSNDPTPGLGFPAISGYNLIAILPEMGLAPGMGNLDPMALPLNNQAAVVLTAEAWTNTTTATLNVVYQIAPLATNGCVGDTVDVTVMIKPEPAISSVTAPAVCSDSPTGFTLPDDPDEPAAATYNITAINPNGLSSSAGNPVVANMVTAAEIANDAWTNATNATVNVVYTIVPVSAAGCAGDPFTVTVPIQPEPIVAFQVETVCSDEALGLLLGASLNSTSIAFYQITSITPNGLIPGMGNATVGNGLPNTAIQNDTWTNTTSDPVNVNYVVIPWGSNGCQGNPFGVTITVNPEPVVADQNKTVCSDEALMLTLGNDLDGPSADTYNITNIESNGLTASAGSPATGNALAANVIEDDAWTNTTNAPVDVVYTVVPVSSDNCAGDPFTVTVTVKPEPVVASFTDGACSDEAIGVVLPDLDDDGLDITTYDISAMVAMGLTGTATTGTNIANINAIAADEFTNITSGPLDVVYTVTPYADGCAGTPFTITVTISPEPVFSTVSTINVCSDDALSYTLPASSTNMLPLTTFDISAMVQGGLTGTATTGTGLNDLNAIANDNFNNLTNGGLSVVYTITPFSNGCEGSSFIVTFNIRAEAVLNPNLDDMVCSDEPIGVTLSLNNTIGFQSVTGYNLVSVTPDAGLAGAMGNAAPGNNLPASAIAADVWTNTTSGILNVVYRVAPNRNDFGCLGDEVDITVMIKPEPAISSVTAPAVCSDSPTGFTLPDDPDVPAAATYNITAINTNGLSASAGNPVVANMVTAAEIADDAWTNASGATVNVVYTIVPVSADLCQGNPFTVTVPVQPEPTVLPQMATICSDEPVDLLLGNSALPPSVSLYNITGIGNVAGLTPGMGNATTGAGQLSNAIENDTWTNTGMLPADIVYAVVPTGSNGCIGDPFSVTITVNPEPVVANQMTTVCSDAVTGLMLGTSSSVAAATYNITNIESNGLTASAGSPATGNALAANVIADDAWTNTTNAPVDVVYTVVPVSSDNCAGDPFTVTVTVKPEPVVASFTDGACSDEAIGVVLPDLDDDGLDITTYDISAMVAMGLTGTATTGTNIANINAIAADEFTNITSGPLDVVYTVTPYADGCAGTPFTITVTISPEPVFSNVSTINVCSDDVLSYTLPASSTNMLPLTTFNISAVLQSGLTGTATTGTGFSDLDAIFNDVFTNLTNGGRTVTYTVTPFSNGCQGEDFTITFNIRAEPVLNPNLDVMVCSDEAVDVILDIDNTMGFQSVTGYDLISVTPDAGLAGAMGNAVPGNNLLASAIAADVWTNTTSGILNVVYRVAPRRSFSCLGDEVDVTVMIKPEPAISSVTAPAVCSDSPTGFTLPDDPDGPAADHYIITGINTNTLSSSAGNPPTMFPTGPVTAAEIADDAWTNATNTTVNVVYTIVPVSADGCEGDPFTVTVPIQPEPIVAFQSKTVCSDEALNLLLGASLNNTAVAFYQITSITPNGLIPGMGNATVGNGLPNTAIQNDTWTNTTSDPVNVNYVVIPWGSNGCQGNPFGVTITVNPEPVVANQMTTVCSDETVGLALGASSSVAAATYNIIDIDGNGLTPGMGNAVIANGLDDDAIENDTWTNTTNASVNVTYTVVPVSAVGCQGNPFTVTVTIDPEPVVSGQMLGVCSNEPIGAVFGDDVDGPAAATYTITAVSIDAGLTAAMGNLDLSMLPLPGLSANAIENDVYENLTPDPLTVTYTVLPVSMDGCAGDPFTITVTISAQPEVADQTATVCSEAEIGVTLGDDPDGPAVTSYNISVTNNGGLTASVGPTTGNGLASDAIELDAWTNTGSLPVVVVYTIVPVAGGCAGDPFTVTVTVNPEPVVAAQSGMACSDAAIGITLGASTSVAAATYNITTIESNGLVASAGMPMTGTGFADSEIANDAWTNTTGATVNVVYTVVPVSSLGCLGDPFTVTVMIKSEPVVANQAQAVCSNVPTGLALGASTNGTPAATYNITDIQTNGLIATAGAPMTGNGLAANVIANDAWQNQGIAPVNVIYTVVPVSAEGCEGDAFTVTITVSPEPVLDVPMSPIALCSDETLGSVWGGITSSNGQPLSFINLTSVTFSSMSPNFTPNPANAAFPANAVPVDYFENDSYTNLTGGGVFVEYTLVAVTPGGCVSAPFTYEFQIRAEPVLNPNLDKTICSGGNTDLTLSLDPTIGFQMANGFVIDNIAVDAGLVGDPGNVMIGDILTSPFLLDDIWTNDTDGPLTVTYSIRPRRANGCFGDVAEVVVTVEPTPVAALVLTYDSQDETISADSNPLGDEYELTICSGENLAAVGVSTVMPTLGSELWVQVELTDSDNVLGYGTSATFSVPYSQLVFNQNIINTTSLPYVISAVITPYVETDPLGSPTLDAEDCEGEAFGLIITVNPEPVAVATPSVTEICDDGSFTVGLNTNGTSVAADQYKVTTAVSDPGLTQTSGNTMVGGTVMLAGPTNTISGTFSNATTSTQTVTYTIVPVSANGCEGDTVVVEIDILARPTTMPSPAAICLGDVTDIMSNVMQGSGTSITNYTWTYLGTTATNFEVNGTSNFLLIPNTTFFNTEDVEIDVSSPLAGTGLIGLRLVVTDDNGCLSLPQTVFVQVLATPDPGTDGNFGPICEDFGNVNLTTLLGGSPDPGGTWAASMGNPAGGTLIGPNFNPAGSVGGIYTFTYTIDNGACPPVSATVTVNVTPNADAGAFDITADNDVCVGEPSFNLFSLLNANSYDLGGTWSELTSSGAGLDAATGELDLTSALPGNYTFRYLVTVGPTVCPNPSDFEDVILNIIAPPAANPILGNAAPCPNTTANYTLTNALQPGTTRVWSLSGGGMLTFVSDDLLTVEWGNTPGTYTLTLVETRLGCSTTNTLQVMITETEANFSFAVGSPDGLTINFTDASVGSPAVWLWNFGDSNTSTSQNPNHTYAAPGQYTVCLDVIGACGNDQICQTIDVITQVGCDQIDLDAGVNIISTDVVPADSSVAAVFSSLIISGRLINVIGIDENGLTAIFDPFDDPDFNTLTHITRGYGYIVRLNPGPSVVLEVCGEPIDETYKVDLLAGLNIVGYVPQSPTTPEVYFDALISDNDNNHNLIVAIGIENGLTQFFDPLDLDFNDLVEIKNGYGYIVRVKNAVSGQDWLIEQDQVEIRSDIPSINVTDNFTFIAGYSNIPADFSGQEVLITDEEGALLGSMRITEDGKLLTCPIFGDDSFVTELKGVQMNQALIFHFGSQQLNTGLRFNADKSLNVVNLIFDLDIIMKENQMYESIHDNLVAYPNPAIEEVTIDFETTKEGVFSLQVFDSQGRFISEVFRNTQLLPGKHRFSWNARRESPGQFVIRLLHEGRLIASTSVIKLND